MAPTILSQKARRMAPPDLSPESIDFLVRERGILYLAGKGFDRQQSKCLIFEAWRARRFNLLEVAGR